jgi:hypothetical protein
MADLAVTATFDLIGVEDLAIGEGTFTRSTSTGGTQTITKINDDSLGFHIMKSVLDYGAVVGGDALTNGDAFQAAFDDGGDILIPGGEFEVDRQLYIHEDGTHVYCAGTVKLQDGAESDGNTWVNNIIHITSARDVSWHGGVIDGNDQNGPNGITISGVDSGSSAYSDGQSYGVVIDNLRIRNCLKLVSDEDDTNEPHANGLGQGGGKGVSIQFGAQHCMLSNITVEDCTIGYAFEGKTSGGGRSIAVLGSNLTANSCRVGLHFLGSYAESPGMGVDNTQVSLSNVVLRDCGTDETEFGAINSLVCSGIRITGLDIINPEGVTVGFRGHFRGCYFDGTVDASQMLHLIDFTRNTDGSHPDTDEGPSRFNTFRLTAKMRGLGTAGDQLTGGLIVDDGTSTNLCKYNRFIIGLMVGNGAGDYIGHADELTEDIYDGTLHHTNYWELYDFGDGVFAQGCGPKDSPQNDGITPALPTVGRVAVQNLAMQNDVENALLTVRASDETQAIGLKHSSGATQAYTSSYGLRINSLPLVLPTFTSTTRDAISPVAEGQVIYNSTTDQINVYANGAWRYWVLT